MRVVITRPRADAAGLAREVAVRGHDVVIEPMLEILPVAAGPPPLAGVQALLLTSAHAAPALGGLALPVLAVGAATARAARAAGVARVEAAGGDAASLARLVRARCRPEDGALLHLCGAEVRPGLAEALALAGFDVRRHVVYRARAAGSLSPALRAALGQRRIGAVLLFSPRTAAVFERLAEAAGVAAGTDVAAAHCLSDAVAAACRALPWRAVHVAAQPTQAALLALLDGPERRW